MKEEPKRRVKRKDKGKRGVPNGKKRAVWGIRRRTLKMIFESAKETYPNEFSAMLRKNREGVVNELLLLPGTVSGNRHAIVKLHMLPVDFSVVGTVHSHPSPNPFPSSDDIHFFSRYGDTHIIAAYPYDMDSWRAYNHDGNEIELEVV